MFDNNDGPALMSEEVAKSSCATPGLEAELNKFVDNLNFMNENLTILKGMRDKLSGPVPEEPRSPEKEQQPNNLMALFRHCNSKMMATNSELNNTIMQLTESI